MRQKVLKVQYIQCTCLKVLPVGLRVMYTICRSEGHFRVMQRAGLHIFAPWPQANCTFVVASFDRAMIIISPPSRHCRRREMELAM